MEQQGSDHTGSCPEWTALIVAVDTNYHEPSEANVEAVRQAALAWAQGCSCSPRDVTSLSGSEQLGQKEKTLQTRAVDHQGTELVPDESGGYTVTATLDEQRPAGDDEEA